jgi:hypothetical protein
MTFAASQEPAMVMKRYPTGISGEFFFIKRALKPRPDFIPICSIKHHSGNVIGFPMVAEQCEDGGHDKIEVMTVSFLHVLLPFAKEVPDPHS